MPNLPDGLRLGAALVAGAVALGGAQTPSPLDSFRRPSSTGVVIAEVLYDPRGPDVPFVELLNAGTAPADVKRMSLRVGKANVLLRRVAEPLAPNERLLVFFDGKGQGERRVLHAPRGAALDPDVGTLELRDDFDRTIDHVAWGTAPGAVGAATGVNTNRGIDSGSTIGRPPGADRPGVDTDWVVYPTGSATPGTANPLPPAADLVPLDGALLETTRASLGWEPIAGASTYRVQVARDDTFASPLADRTATEPALETDSLAAGSYVWRVQAIAANGMRSAFSAVSHFDLQPAGGMASVPRLALSVRTRRAIDARSLAVAASIAVPYLTQHKDSPMLLLESQTYRGPHPWDADHRTPSRIDLADTQNCAVANIAMINHFYGGDLTQDRIGYEVLSRNIRRYVPALRRLYMEGLTQGLGASRATQVFDGMTRERAPGPERDLVYGAGIRGMQITAALIFALGVEPDFWGAFQTRGEMWEHIVREIGAGRPILAANRTHTMTIRAYAERGNRRFVSVNDPANGRYEIDLAGSALAPATTSFWLFPPGARGTLEEPTVTADLDGDNVVDFDEVERFMTDPNRADTDGDGVRDKEDIASGVFEREFGYGYAYTLGRGVDSGRDYDDDHLATERDPDSDNGGCKDGEEDTNGDGFRTGNERSNFYVIDDVCGSLAGSITHVISMSKHTDPGMDQDEEFTLTISVALKQDPSQPDHYLDDGSLYSFKRVAHVSWGGPGCQVYSRITSHGSGRFIGDEYLAAGGVSTDGLAVDFHGEVPSEATTDLCGIAGTTNNPDTFTTDDCIGRPRRDQSLNGRTFNFNCGRPRISDPSIVIHRWTTLGTVRLR